MDRDKLLEILNSEDETDRVYAIEDVIDLKPAELYPDVVKHIHKEESILVRELIVEALKVLDVSDLFSEIAKYFESSDAYIRNCAIEIFGAKGEEAVAFLTSIMDHSNKEVRKLVLDSLVATSSKYSIPALRAALKDRAPNVMITAVEYLGKIYDEESINDIMEIFEVQTEPMTRISCLETLIIMGNPAIVDRVLSAVGGKSMDSFFKPSVFRLVGEKGALRHLDFLLFFMNNKNSMYLRELSNGILKIMAREELDRLDEEHTKFIMNNLENRECDDDTRSAMLCIVDHMDLADKNAIYEGLTSDSSEAVALQAFEYLASLDRERACKLIDKKIKMADGEFRRTLENLKDGIDGQ